MLELLLVTVFYRFTTSKNKVATTKVLISLLVDNLERMATYLSHKMITGLLFSVIAL